MGNSISNENPVGQPTIMTHYHMIDANTIACPRETQTVTSDLQDLLHLSPQPVFSSDENVQIYRTMTNQCYFASIEETIDQPSIDNQVMINLRAATTISSQLNTNQNNNNKQNESATTKLWYFKDISSHSLFNIYLSNRFVETEVNRSIVFDWDQKKSWTMSENAFERTVKRRRRRRRRRRENEKQNRWSFHRRTSSMKDRFWFICKSPLHSSSFVEFDYKLELTGGYTARSIVIVLTFFSTIFENQIEVNACKSFWIVDWPMHNKTDWSDCLNSKENNKHEKDKY